MLNFAQVSNRSIGTITFDVVTTEDHQSDLSITENPIESGAAIADHAVIQPKQVTINGVMVDHDHSTFGLDLPFIGNIRGGIDFLNSFPLPVKVITQTSQSIARAGRAISQVAGAYSQAKSILNQARAIAPFLPDFGLGGLLDSSAGDSRVQKCYADLVACQKSGETIDIQTGINLYKNMLIQSVAVNQSQDGSATFTITAREIFIVETQTAQSKSSASGKNKSGRAAAQSATKSQQGSTQPKSDTPKRTSSLFNLFKWW
ncbi:TPA: phage baseplate protein [Haemophilus influenzae]